MASKRGIQAGKAYVTAYWDDSRLVRGIRKTKAMLGGLADSVAAIGTKAIGVGLGLGSLFAAPLKRAAMLEMMRADLEVLLGSTQAAEKALADFRKFAAETPLEFADVAELGKQLLNWKLASGDNVVEIMRQIGDAAGGVPERMQGVVRALGQMRATGRIQADEMNQLTEQGIPAWELLAKVLGTDVAGAMKMVTARQVDATTAVPGLVRAMGEWGGGRMAKQARTLIGRFSALKDAIWDAVTPIGEALLPSVGRFVELAATAVSRLGEWIKANASLAPKIAATAAALVVFGSAAVALSVAMRALSLVVGGLGIAVRVVLFPATVLVTVAMKTLAATFVLATGLVRGAQAAVVAFAGTLKMLGLVSGLVSSALTLAAITMTLLRRSATLTAAGIAALSIVTYGFRAAVLAAQAAVALLGGALRMLGATLAVVGAAFAVLGSPVGAILVAIVGLGAAIYYVRDSGLSFGKVLDWIIAKFGPLAQKVMEVGKVIHDAFMAGQIAAGVKVLWAAIQLAFANGIAWVRSAWVDLTANLASVFIDLAAQVETIWANLTASLVSGFAASVSNMLALAADLAGKLGLSDKAMELGAMSTGFGFVGRTDSAAGERAAIEERRKATQETLAEDAERRRAGLGGDAAKAAEDLAVAMDEAKAATEAATAEQPEAPPTPSDSFGSGSDLPAKADTAINTAAVVGTSAGADAFFRAQGGKDGLMLQREANALLKNIDRHIRGPIVVAEGKTR